MTDEVFTGAGRLSNLANLGNTCYMNSALQCLRYTIPLSKYLLSGNYKEDVDVEKREWLLVKEYIRVLEGMWESNGTVRPNAFKKILAMFNIEFFGWNQNDSHEVIKIVLDKLHDAMSYEVSICVQGEAKNETDNMAIEAIRAWSRAFDKEYSEIVTIFYGQLCSSIRCGNCNNVSNSYDAFNDIALPVTNECNSIYDCFDRYTYSEILEDDAKYSCDNCKQKTDAKKQITMWRVPKILIIVLKRFDPINPSSKNNRFINFPIDGLRLKKYVSGYCKDSAIYDLYGVSNHIGAVAGGHYYSYCKNPNGRWYCYNDDATKRIQAEEVVSNNAYVLFYQKR